MSGVTTCESCKGSGKFIALGNFIEKCPPCLGVGYVSHKVSVTDVSRGTKSEAVKDKEYNEMIEPKKRGRKKRDA